MRASWVGATPNWFKVGKWCKGYCLDGNAMIDCDLIMMLMDGDIVVDFKPDLDLTVRSFNGFDGFDNLAGLVALLAVDLRCEHVSKDVCM